LWIIDSVGFSVSGACIAKLGHHDDACRLALLLREFFYSIPLQFIDSKEFSGILPRCKSLILENFQEFAHLLAH